MAKSSESQKRITEQLEKADDTLRPKYRQILDTLSINELKRFDKHKYKLMIMSEITELVPDANSKQVDETAQYISNHLGNEAPRVKGQKLQQQTKSQTRRSTRNTASCSDTETQSKSKSKQSENINPKVSSPGELSDTMLNELDTSMDLESTLESTVTDSFMDDTYETSRIEDDSMTELKTPVPTEDTNSRSKQDKLNSPTNESVQITCDSEIQCIDSCTVPKTTPSFGCNMCMNWFHTPCVGISDVDAVGAWTCAGCRKLPETVNKMKSDIDTLLGTTSTILKIFKSFSEKIDNKFENLNDRLTAIANQNKCYDESSTSSMTDIRQDLKTIKSEVELKTGSILSKSQSILDKVKSTSDLVSKINDDTSANIKNVKPTTSNRAKQTDQKDQHKIIQGQKGSNKAPECIQTPMANDAIITISDDDHDQSSPIPIVTPTCSQSSSLKDKPRL